MNEKERDVKIRIVILFECCKRAYGQSENEGKFFYVIPELQEYDNKVIDANMIYLINENLVRGGVDEAGSFSTPWITRINSTGMELVEKMVNESESQIPELKTELKDEKGTQERVMSFIKYCFKNKEIPIPIMNIVKDIVL
ncbi:MAG: hypothetical protein EA447_00860 [Nitrosopumilus sp.]|nr:MAG: hypothetical protein EA447_00860 [Nitrosopumilus sp.]